MARGRETNGSTRKVAASAWCDVVAIRGEFPGRPAGIMVHARELPSPRAHFAMQCVERWAMVAGEAAGEDTAGRQKLRRMTADELAVHACACAEKLFAQFRDRGWILAVPAYEQVVDAVENGENSND